MKGNGNYSGYYNYYRTEIDNKFYWIVNIYDASKNLTDVRDVRVYNNNSDMKECLKTLDEEGFGLILNITEGVP